jgi:CheY-like chemotaxis protein
VITIIKSEDVVEILLVEDDPSDAKLTKRVLRKAGLTNDIHHVTDGEQALDFLFCREGYAGRDITRPPRVVLLDVKLPKVDGIEVLREIRGDPRTASLPVVLLTSSRQDSDLDSGYDLGANSYIVKPVDFTQFGKTVEVLGMYWLLVNTPPRTNVETGAAT